ncbi:hypothetical protein KL942_004448 [Ogataea angusta]|uniref:Secreted protein n=1 Tax=Pichia angusta TaxID=870730 RepID=A0ABQ7RUK3_PICAN|nr:hypothetical protein KL942_004448 [Ogataea angusta]KAG7847669.1 hypothetical protein KL940_003581 [Ogataea angusta]
MAFFLVGLARRRGRALSLALFLGRRIETVDGELAGVEAGHAVDRALLERKKRLQLLQWVLLELDVAEVRVVWPEDDRRERSLGGDGVFARQVGDVVFVRLAQLDAFRAVRVNPGERLRDGTKPVQPDDVCVEGGPHGLVRCVLVDKIMHGDDRRERPHSRSISFGGRPRDPP